jgi:predicted DCC family thiol-disulfide oxidoreductase YuxK
MTPVLLYDGQCGLCTRIVQFVLRVESERTLRFAPLAGEFAREVLSRHRELEGVDSIVWVAPAPEPSRELVFVRSEAAIRLGMYLGGRWRVLAHVARWIPPGLRDRLYDWVARRRRRWFANATTCLILNRWQQERLIS